MLHRTLEALTSTLQDTIDDAREVRVLDPVNIIGSLNLTKSRKDSLIYNLDQAGESTSDAWGLYNYINEVNRLRSRRWDSAWAADEGLLDDVKLLAQAQGGAT
jgi:hypothetical protein